MNITGDQLINGEWQKGKAGNWQAVNPSLSSPLAPAFTMAELSQVREAIEAAANVAKSFARSEISQRVDFLNAIADELGNNSALIKQRFCEESGYPFPRAVIELNRTVNQLRFYAKLIASGEFLDIRIDEGNPDRLPVPKPDLRSMNIPIGPVSVFGAANFPLAYSVAGGDAVSALAAGCPILVKGHPSHPGCCELVARAMENARIKVGLPAGIISLLHGSEKIVGETLVSSPEIKAVGFTGSFRGGMALKAIADQRSEPIPVFAEMGSINPVVLLPEALEQNTKTIASGYINSLTLHTGQYCVNPGLVIAIDSPALDVFEEAAKEAIQSVDAGVMLNAGIYERFLEWQKDVSCGLDLIALGQAADSKGYYVQSGFYKTTAVNFLNDPNIQEEIFGPAGILVVCRNLSELYELVGQLRGQLTTSLHSTEDEYKKHEDLVQGLINISGRFVVNGFPTGVEVAHSTVHGGPFPATTDSRFTSVGARAIYRFLRPVCYQNCPESLLPNELKSSNPLNLLQRINGSIKLKGTSKNVLP